MSVATSTNKVSYTLTTGSQACSVPFYFLENAHIKAIASAETGFPQRTLVLGTDYTLTGALNPAGGTLTTIATVANGLKAGSKITIKREVEYTQEIVYTENDQFPAKTHEKGLDVRCMAEQQLKEQIDRAIRYPESEDMDGELPIASERAFKVQSFDANGEIEMIDRSQALFTEGDAITFPNVDAMLAYPDYSSVDNNHPVKRLGYYIAGDGGGDELYVDKADTTTASDGGFVHVAEDGTRIKSVKRNIPDVLKFGLKLDGVTNGATRLGEILEKLANYSNPSNETAGGTAAAPAGGRLDLPIGTLYLTSGVTMPIYTSLVGQNQPHMGNAEAGYFNTRVSTNAFSDPVIIAQACCVIDGVNFQNPTTTIPECIRITGEDVRVEHCQFDTHTVAINFKNAVVNVDPVFAIIRYNQFFHNNSTSASIINDPTLANHTAMGSALIEFNNFNIASSSGYTGYKYIEMNGTYPLGITVRKNIFQGAATANNAVGVKINGTGANIEDNDIAAAFGTNQTALSITGSGCSVRGNRILNSAIGIRMPSGLTNSVIGPNYFSGNTTDILIDSGCEGNIIIAPSPATVIVDNSGGKNLIIYPSSGGYNTEGTWTPALKFGGASVGMTYAAQAGHYTRQGNAVTAWGRIVLSAKGSSTGSASVTGLPFAIRSDGSQYGAGGIVSVASNLSGVGNGTLVLTGSLGASSLSLQQGNSGTGYTTASQGNFTDSSEIAFCVTYLV